LFSPQLANIISGKTTNKKRFFMLILLAIKHSFVLYLNNPRD
jgi:hypothetical protein